MESVVDFFVSLGPWNWFILAGLLLLLETVLPGVHFLWFGLAAFVVGAVTMATGAAWPAQFIGFAVMAILVLFVVRRFAEPSDAASDSPGLNVRAEQYIGRVVTVEEAIVGGRGKVRVGDTVWAAQGDDVPVGARVRVTGVSGTSLVVEAAA